MGGDGCAEIRPTMAAVVDREASELDEARLRRHLAGCASCAAIFDEHLAIARAMRGSPLVRPPGIVGLLRVRRLVLAGTGIVIAVGIVVTLLR